MTDSLLIKNIQYVVTCNDRDEVLQHVNLYIEDGVIRSLNQEEHSAKEVIDGSHMAAYPGLINTHHHLYQIFTRNLPQVQNLELFPWLRALYALWKNLDEDTVFYTSLVGMGELLKTGCTTCFDQHYVFPKDSFRLIDRQFEAAEKLGIRMHASRGSMSLGKKDGGLPPDSIVQSTPDILADSRDLIERYHDPSPYSMRQVALAPCSPFSATEDLFKESADLARAYHVRLHTHLAETLDEENYMLDRFGMRPLAYMEKMNWLGDDVWFAHGIHFNDRELDLLADTGTGITHCPISNMKLSSGTARIPDMLERGIPVGLGVDGSASNDGSNLLEELRMGYLLHRLIYGEYGPSAYDMLKMATRGGAKVLGRDDIGQLAPGKGADCFLIDTRRLELVGAMFDPKSMPASVGYKGNVDYTIANGKIVVRKGHLTTIDEEKIYRKASALQLEQGFF